MRPFVRIFVGVALGMAVAISGCTGYKLGDPVDVPFQTIHVPPPVNASLAPQAAALLGTALRQELEQSGRVALGGAGADAVLSVTISGLEREISAEQESDTALARKWRVTLSADCSLANPRTGQIFFERRKVSAFDEVYVDGGLVAAEYQNMPVLTRRLAEAIAREVLHVW